MPPAARVGDDHECTEVTGVVPHVGGPILGPGAVNVLLEGMPASIVGDECECEGPVDMTVMGSATVMISNKPSVRQDDETEHGGMIVAGAPTVLIGG
ncbi:MAG: PAAR domain-containing protein [Planctomycetaceae bacterium]|nr:PAAR domain-containing protein [Planctomycetaceae bacterium]MCA9110173.1 PAAR domain-containing protein [Planctomycetaceae bacterium]